MVATTGHFRPYPLVPFGCIVRCNGAETDIPVLLIVNSQKNEGLEYICSDFKLLFSILVKYLFFLCPKSFVEFCISGLGLAFKIIQDASHSRTFIFMHILFANI